MAPRSSVDTNRLQEPASAGRDASAAAQARDLPAMVATMRSYDHLFGPRHIQTLLLAAQIAEVLQGLGEPLTALSLLERVVRDLNQSVGRTHAARIPVLQAFRDLLLKQSDITRAIAVQAEISASRLLLHGTDAAETITARTDLGALLMLSSEGALGN